MKGAERHEAGTGAGMRARLFGAGAGVASLLLALVATIAGLGGPLASLFAAVWLILIPALTLGQTAPPPAEMHAHRLGFYATSIVVLAAAGILALLLAPGLAQQPGLWLDWPRLPEPPVVPAFLLPRPAELVLMVVLIPAALLTATCVAVAYGFKRLAARLDWHETETVRALMPVTRREKGVFALLSVAAGTSEEIVFRGFLPAFLLPWTGSYLVAALPVAVVFGFLHAYQGRHGVVRTATVGVLLAVGVAWTGNLWPSIFAHVALDLLFGLVLSKSLLGEPPAGSPSEGSTWT